MGPPLRKLLRAAIVLACVAALGVTIAALGPRRVALAAAAADPGWLALSVVPVVGRFVIWGVKWRRMLARERAVPLGPAIGILAAGSFVNLVTPTAKLAGGVVRAALLHRRHGWRLATAYGWAMADQVTNVLGNVLVFGVLALAVGATREPGVVATSLLVAGGAALAALAAFVVLRPWLWRLAGNPRLSAALARIVPPRLRGDGDGARRVLRPLLAHGGVATTLLPDVAWSSVAFLSVCLANALVLRSLGSAASLTEVSVAVAIAYFAGVLVGFGGVGVTEAALTGLWIEAGVPAEQAAAAALLHRAVFYATVIALGAPAVWRWRDSLSRRTG